MCDGFVNQGKMYLDSLLIDLETRLSFILKGKYWLWKVTFISIFLFVVIDFSGNMSKVVYFRTFINDFVRQGKLDQAHGIVKAQSEDYFSFFKEKHDADIATYQHEAKMKFRLFLPTLVRVFGVAHFDIWLYLLAIGLGIVYIYLIGKMVLRILGEDVNRVIVLFFVAGISNLYAGVGSFVLDIVPYGDFFAFFFLLLSIYYRNPLIIFLACQCAFWVDERAFINAVYVMLWWSFIAFEQEEWKFKFSWQAMAVIVSGVVYLGIRYYLTNKYQLPDSVYLGEFITTFQENLKMILLRVWSGFEGMWLLILLGFCMLIREKYYQLFWALLGSLVVSVCFALIAYDANRGLSYGFIVLFVSLAIGKKYLSEKEMKYVLLVCLIVSLLSPTLNKYRIVGGGQLM